MGGESKVTAMGLKVDLGCPKCRRKIKSVLCSIPQVRDQIFDYKNNIVLVTVTCCTPEKVREKIWKKARGTVKDIDIKTSQPQANPPAQKPKDGPPPPAEKPKQTPPPPAAEKPKSQPPPAGEKPKPSPPPSEKPKPFPPPSEKPKSAGDGGKPNPPPQQAAPHPQQQAPPPNHAMKANQPAAFMTAESIPVAGYPSIFPPVVYYDGGPYYQNQGMPAPPQTFSPHQQPIYQYDGYVGRPVGNYYGGASGYKSDYFSEDNPSICSVM